MSRQKTTRDRLWAALEKDASLRSMCERFTVKKNRAKQLLEEAAKEKQQDKNGRQKGSAYKEERELLPARDLRFDGPYQSKGKEGSHCRMALTAADSRHCIWWVPSGLGKKQSNWWCAACGGQ